MKNLRLERPLAVFDLETTGTDPGSDRIVEISVLRFEPDGRRTGKTWRMNPERPIPPGATAIHGIRDEDVASEPTFRRLATEILAFLDGADLAGFNVLRFDLPLLDREFRDTGADLDVAPRRIVDAMRIFHRKEPRNLSAAVRFYLDEEHGTAHTAEGDVEVTARVLDAQLERYDDVPRSVEDLDAWCCPRPEGAIDRSGKFVWRNETAVFGFGKHQGKPLRQVAAEAPDYLRWVAKSDFPEDAKELVRNALDGRLPEPPRHG